VKPSRDDKMNPEGNGKMIVSTPYMLADMRDTQAEQKQEQLNTTKLLRLNEAGILNQAIRRPLFDGRVPSSGLFSFLEEFYVFHFAYVLKSCFYELRGFG
jgi:hypothetical protein